MKNAHVKDPRVIDLLVFKVSVASTYSPITESFYCKVWMLVFKMVFIPVFIGKKFKSCIYRTVNDKSLV